MLDPITALGLASNIIQLVDFASKLLEKSTEIRRNGEAVDHGRLRAAAVDLENLSRSIKTSTSVPDNEHSDRAAETPQETALVMLSEDCCAVANELIECLNTLKGKSNQTLWSTFRQAIRTIWSKEKVMEMASTLENYRSELALRTLTLLNTKVGRNADAQERRLNTLEQQNYDVIEAITISQKLGAREAASNRHLHEKTQHQLQEVIAAILTYANGDTTAIPYPAPQYLAPESFLNGQAASRQVMRLQTRTQDNWSMKSSVNDFEIVKNRVLDSLAFRTIRDRIDEVALAHRATFKWVFNDPTPQQRPWSNLLQWLREGDGCYWISGKAGSGKSTLMKHICYSEEASAALTSWAGEGQLLVASFFSWNLGSVLQKSHIGLLRSLLHDILEHCPYLIPTLLPKLCKAAVAGQDVEPTFAELKTGIMNLARQNSTSLKICLFIDGIDEFDGDHAEISTLFTTIASSSIKIVLTSRPIPTCVDVFSDCPSLRLQDLTYHDIRLYTEEKVSSHRRWRELLDEEGEKAGKLIDDIVSKAEGVFLWVILAVASLLEGLRNYDKVSDLRRRLEILPPDLEDLYNHMLIKLEPLYRCQASRLLQIVYRHIEVESEQPFSALQISFADEEDPEYAFRRDLEPLTTNQKLARCRSVEGRLRSRCCGLVEVWQDWRENETTRLLKSRVMFLHRTVVEFLRKPDVQKGLTSHLMGTDFHPSIALATGFLIDVKTQSAPLTLNVFQCPTWESMRRCLNFCRQEEKSTEYQFRRIVNELDATMNSLWTSGGIHQESKGRRHEPVVTNAATNFDWTHVELRTPNLLWASPDFAEADASMFVLAAALGLTHYIGHRCTWYRASLSPEQLRQAMLATVYRASCVLKECSTPRTFREHQAVSMDKYQTILECLLNAGANPNHFIGAPSSSPWSLALQETYSMTPCAESLTWCNILRALLRSGANLNETARDKKKSFVRHSSALAVISTMIMKFRDGGDLIPNSTTSQVVDILNDIRMFIEQNGGKYREWTEPLKEQKRQRDATPAPWTTEEERKAQERGAPLREQRPQRKASPVSRNPERIIDLERSRLGRRHSYEGASSSCVDQSQVLPLGVPTSPRGRRPAPQQQSQGDGTDIYRNAKEKHKSMKFSISKVISSAKKRLSFH